MMFFFLRSFRAAIIPLIIGEPGSAACTRLWNDADRVVSVRLLYPEARAALAKARRVGRITTSQCTRAVTELELVVGEVDAVEVTQELVQYAGELADRHELRGYDAVHLAATVSVAGTNFVLATGDSNLAVAARALGLAVAFTS